MGVAIMRNSAIYKAKGKYIKFVDDDDASVNVESLKDSVVMFKKQLDKYHHVDLYMSKPRRG